MSEVEQLRAAVASVRAIHVRTAFDDSAFDGSPDDFYCKPCQTTAGIWPCLTIQALDGAPEPDSITIPRPVVPFGPVSKAENEATADYLLEVVKKIDGKYCTVGGSNVTATVRKLLLEVADAVRGLPVGGESKP